MASNVAFKAAWLACVAAICMVKPIHGQEVFDVTKYGAKADGTTENSKAFLAAWEAACKYNGTARFVIPGGTFLLGPVSFLGPCHNGLSPAVEIDGTLKALPDLQDFPTVVWVEFKALHELSVRGRGTLDGQGAQSWNLTTCPRVRQCKNLPTSLRFMGINNATISDLTLVNSKGFHMNLQKSASIHVHNLTIKAPADSPNTDGIHISGTDRANITSSNIATGDDCISIGPGTSNVLITGVVCGPGHGISVGSLGKYPNEKDVIGLRVKNCTLSDTKNGLRIKTWPGSPASKASNITFEDVIVENVSNPIIIDQEYCPIHKCTDKPSLVKISDVTFRNVRGTTDTEVAVNIACSKSIPCEMVKLQDINLEYLDGTSTSSCSNVRAIISGEQKPAAPCQ